MERVQNYEEKILKVSLFTILSLFVFINIPTITNAQEIPQPNKTEYIKVENEKIPVFYFDDPEEADLHRIKWAEASQELYNLKNGDSFSEIKTIEPEEINSRISTLALTKYTYKSYAGTAPYKYKFNVYENRTNSPLKLTRKVTNSASSTTSISVGASFKNIFKAEVGKTYSSSASFSDTFKLNIPKKKQGEIWSWNYAQKYNFQQKKAGKTTNFTAWRPTQNYGSAVYYLNFRDPS